MRIQNTRQPIDSSSETHFADMLALLVDIRNNENDFRRRALFRRWSQFNQRFRPLALIASFCLCAIVVTYTAAQDGSRQRPLPGPNDVSPSQIIDLAIKLRALDPSAFKSSDAMKQVEALRKANPNLTDQQLAEQMMAKMGIKTASEQNSFMNMLKQMVQNQGGGTPPSNPNVPAKAGGANEKKSGLTPSRLPNLEQALENSDIPSRGVESVGQGKLRIDAPNELPQLPRSNLDGDRKTAKNSSLAQDIRQQERMNAVSKWWENRIGPIDQTPVVADLMKEFVLNPADANSGKGNMTDFASSLSKQFDDLKLSTLFPSDAPNLPKDWKLSNLDVNLPSTGGSNIGGSSSFDMSFGSSLDIDRLGSGFIGFLALILVILVGFMLQRYWPIITKRLFTPEQLGNKSFTFSPDDVKDRASLIREFEAIALHALGQSVRTWHHARIANEFRHRFPDISDNARELAQAYALARYLPDDWPFPAHLLLQSRQNLARLVGVPAV